MTDDKVDSKAHIYARQIPEWGGITEGGGG